MESELADLMREVLTSHGQDLPEGARLGLEVKDGQFTGEIYWEERLGGKGEFAASPLVANGHVFAQTVYGGETIVIKPGKKLNVISRNGLGVGSKELFRATLAPIKGRIYARSLSTLYCIGS